MVQDHLDVGVVVFLVFREPSLDFGLLVGEALDAVLLVEADDVAVAVQVGRLGHLVGVLAGVVEVDDMAFRLDEADFLDGRRAAGHPIGGGLGVRHHAHVALHGHIGGVRNGIKSIIEAVGMQEHHVAEIDLQEILVIVQREFRTLLVQEAERLVHGAYVELAVHKAVLEPERALGHLRHQVEDVGGDAHVRLGRQARQGQGEEGEAEQSSFHGRDVCLLAKIVQILVCVFKSSRYVSKSASYSVSLILE